MAYPGSNGPGSLGLLEKPAQLLILFEPQGASAPGKKGAHVVESWFLNFLRRKLVGRSLGNGFLLPGFLAGYNLAGYKTGETQEDYHKSCSDVNLHFSNK